MISQALYIKHAIGAILRRWLGMKKKMDNIAKKWKSLSGQNNWENLLEPLDIDLRRYIIHYGEMAQATYDAFDTEKVSKFAGSSRFAKKDFFSKVSLDKASPFKYRVTKFLYATSKVDVPEAFIIKSLSREAWRGIKLDWVCCGGHRRRESLVREEGYCDCLERNGTNLGVD